jgi:nucleoid-associated protein YgaU
MREAGKGVVMKKLLLVLSIALLFLVAGIIAAQSLKDNPDYKKALEYQQLAEQAQEKGEYDKAYEYAQLASDSAKKAGEYADSMLVQFQANSLIRYLENQFSTMNKGKAQSDYPDDYAGMMSDYDAAKAAYDAADYQESLDAARRAKDKLDSLLLAMAEPATQEPAPEVTMKPEVTPTPEPVVTEPPVVAAEGVYPKYYVVQWIPANRDNLWKIAGFSFIYNNPRNWEYIYEANKDKFVNPKNPRFIVPKQILEIPSIAGETREGTYVPGKKYPVFPKD